MEGIPENEETDSESEPTDEESYLTCDSGVTDDEGSTESNISNHIQSSRKRTRSSDNEFSDALDRYFHLSFFSTEFLKFLGLCFSNV
jgi:hypothetical protein